MTYQIKNQEIFDRTVYNLDIDVKNSGYGNILIITPEGENIEIDGQHGQHDYEEKYGFVLIEN